MIDCIILSICEYLIDYDATILIKIHNCKLMNLYHAKSYYTIKDTKKFKFHISKIIISKKNELKNLSKYVTHILFYDNYNETIENNISSTIISIEFGYKFNQNINNIIFPPQLTYLKFGDKFNKEIKNLPNSLKR